MTDTAQAQQFAETPEGWASRWQFELAAAKKHTEKFRTAGDKVVSRFLDEREATDELTTKWNLFTSNVQTQRALLFGRIPPVDVTRRWADASDDLARIGGEVLQRCLNADIEKDSDSFAEAFGNALSDFQLPGLGLVRARYVAEFGVTEKAKPPQLAPDGRELAPAVPAVEGKTYECVDIDYVHWKDVLWSPSRVWSEVRWVAFRAEMSKEELDKRFPEHAKLGVPLSAKRSSNGDDSSAQQADPWARAEVHEVWSKEHGKVFWYVEGYPRVLDEKPDPLGLSGFFPCPRPMLSNVTTKSTVPKSDYMLAVDLYTEIDEVSCRIKLLQEAIRVAGCYDKSADEIKQLLSNSKAGNKLYPVENWALFAEKGGLRNQVDWLPLEPIVAALLQLITYRAGLIDALHQQTGMADIMRGQASQAATATEQRIKAQFGSVRMQAMQDEFARFVSDAQRIKAEIIGKHFDAQTILQRSNSRHMPEADQQHLEAAVELIKSPDSMYRVEVKPESISLADFAAQQQESMGVLQAIGAFLTAAGPMAQAAPGSTPFLLQILQWSVARVKGGSGMEGILDQAIAMAQQAQKQAAQNPQAAPPDPKLQAQQLKGQQEMAKIQADTKAKLMLGQAQVAEDAQREENQARFNIQEHAAKTQISESVRASRPQGMGGGQSR